MSGELNQDIGELINTVTGLLVKQSLEILASVPGCTGDVIVNALLGTAVNMAWWMGGTPSHVQTCFRKVAQSVPDMYRIMTELNEAEE